ncbi:MAG: hypothetical protein RIQ47_787 [Bacteroidota bacterium]|jgi:DNA-binding transcriptional MerR regulator
MPYKEKEIEKLYYTIGEVAQLFGVNTSHIRFWSNEFDIIRPATNKKGNRLYTREDLDNFRKIYHLVKEKGYTLRGAKTELRDLKLRPSDETAASVEMDEVAVLLAEPPIPTVTTPTSYEPIDQASAVPLMGQLSNDDFVDRMAIRTSLEKVKSSLLQLQKELDVLGNS